MKNIFIITALIYSSSLFSQTFRGLVSQKKILKNKQKATVSIKTFNKGKLTNSGSGFFLEKYGLILTNKHVLLKHFRYNDKDITVEIKTHDGVILSDIKVLRCGNKNKIDLCLLKTDDYKPKAYFKASVEPLALGHHISFIGHCKGDWTQRKGKVLKIYDDFLNHHNVFTIKENLHTQMIQISTEVCEGDSGSAIYSPLDGSLKGVVTLYYHLGDNKRWNMGITTKEIKNFLKLSQRELSLPSFQIHGHKAKKKKRSRYSRSKK